MRSGIYAKAGANPDTRYLQASHFDRFGKLDLTVEPVLQSDASLSRHLLQDGDVLFVAKGQENFGVVYTADYGRGVASSSFVVVRVNDPFRPQLLPAYLSWFLTNTPEIAQTHRKQLSTTVPSISLGALKQLVIAIPPVEQQQRILDLNALSLRETALYEELTALKRKVIKQRLFNAISND